MKKMMILMLMVFVAVLNVNGQLIVDFTDFGQSAVLPGGAKMDITNYPGWNTFERGYTIQENVAKYFRNLRKRVSIEEYNRQVRLAAAQGISVPMGGAMVGGAIGGVYGGGMQVSEGNLLTTYGSGIYASYDTGTNSLAIGGDPLMAVGRTLDYFGGKLTSKKKRAAKAAKAAAAQQTRSAQQQNVVVVYVDSATGKVVKTSQAPAQQTRSAQPATMQGQLDSAYSGF